MADSILLIEGKYEILAKIREGGMGAIYRVRHRLLDEIRVVKVMRPHLQTDPDLQRRFLDEAKIATRLKHPNVCTIHDFAIDGATAYLVMEHVDGVNLADFTKWQGLPGVALTTEIAHQALLALGYLHRRGVVHRDVAPDNLMLTYDEDHRPLLKLIDLGIAKVVDREADVTARGVFLGKPTYASPEQLGSLPPGEKLDGRSDLYSLGIVLYELLTGRRPFEGTSPAELLKAQQLNRIVPFEKSDAGGHVPRDLREVVLRALERRREDRFATAEDFDAAIVRVRSRYGPRPRVEMTPRILAEIHGHEPAPPAVTTGAQARLDRNFAAAASVPLPPTPKPSRIPEVPVDPDSLRTVRLPVERPAAPPRPSVASVDLMGIGAAENPRGASSVPLGALPGRAAASRRDRGMREPDMGIPLKQVPARNRRALLEGVAFALAALAVFAVWWSWPSRSARPAAAVPAPQPVATAAIEAAAATPVEAPAAASPSSESVTSAPALTPPSSDAVTALALTPPSDAVTAAPALTPPLAEAGPSAVTGAPVSGALSEPSPAAAPPPAVSPPAAITSSTPATVDELAVLSERTAAARRRADDARGQAFAPSTYQRALAKEAAAEKLARKGSAAQARGLYRQAADLFARAAAAGQEARTPAPRTPRTPRSTAAAPGPPPASTTLETSAERNAEAPPPASTTGERGADAPPTARAEAPLGSGTDTRSPAEADSVAEARRRIRQVISDYAWSRRTRNAGLLAEVFPSDRTRFTQDSSGASGPTVMIDVETIDIDSLTHATATVQERVIVADTPAGGAPEWSTIVLELERRGGRWAIVSRRRL